MEKYFKNWILDYGIIARRRFYRKEKIRFIKNIEQEFKTMGYATKILSPRGSKGKAIDLLIGDVKTAKKIIISSYDTPVKSFYLYSYKPFDLRKRNIYYLLTTAVPLLVVSTLCFVFSTMYLKIEWMKGIFHWSDIALILVYLLGIIFIVRYARGIPNGRNLDRNSSGVLAVLNLAKSLDDAQKEKTAFVLTDFGCINHLGDQMLKAYLNTYDKKEFILLECIGNNEDMGVCYSPSLESTACKLDKQIHRFPMSNENNIAHLYPNTIVFSNGLVKNESLIVPHVNTRQDMNIDPDRIQYISDQICNIL
ncbi:hypothetical protein ACWG0P_02750 [Amedibacillus sp. YH-ame6]